MTIEVELKARVRDLFAIERALLEQGAKPLGKEQHIDVYFNAPDRDFAVTDEALRLRVVDGVSLLTYKGPKLDKRSKTRVEHELEIQDGGAMQAVLQGLGFLPRPPVKKTRQRYELDVVEYCLDQVDGLGSFMELEILVETKDEIGAAVDLLESRLEGLGISKDQLLRKSYLELQLDIKENEK